MSTISETLAWADPRSPYARGEADGLAGKPGPAFPTPDSSWADRLYNRGWEAGVHKRAQAKALGMLNMSGEVLP
jgi:hypothetical protein